jgi:hypothetical protein
LVETLKLWADSASLQLFTEKLEMFPNNTNSRNRSNTFNNYIITAYSWWNDPEYLALLKNPNLKLYSLQST